ncbi:Uncharacterised protein [Serratia proteamaculans]|nr:Uncharacterised protein [Serratia proteamaculans]
MSSITGGAKKSITTSIGRGIQLEIKIAFNAKLLQRNDIGQRISLPMSWERQHEQHGFYY